jgi:predicted kinase
MGPAYRVFEYVFHGVGRGSAAAADSQRRCEQRQELVELMLAGRDVVVDSSFWSRTARDDYKALVEGHGCRWELVHLKAGRATLKRRLEVRNGEEGANAVTVDQEPFDRYLANFEEPNGEGEQVVMQSST